MNVIAYTAERYEVATRRVVGREAAVLTCPPLHDGHFTVGLGNHGVFAGYDVTVLNLHGYPGAPVWNGDDGVIAMKRSTLESQPGFSPGVFAISCNLGDPGHPMAQALWAAGAEWLIAGDGENYGGTTCPAGADVVLRWFLRSLESRTPEGALDRAKRWAKWTAPRFTGAQRGALRDALEFEVMRRPDNGMD